MEKTREAGWLYGRSSYQCFCYDESVTMMGCWSMLTPDSFPEP